MRSASASASSSVGVGQQQDELLAAEARGDVVRAQLLAEDVGDAPRTASPARWPYVLLISRSRSRSIISSASGCSVRCALLELLVQDRAEVPDVEEAGLRSRAAPPARAAARRASGGSGSSGATANGISAGLTIQHTRRATPSAASTRSVDRLSNENRPDSRERMPAPEAQHQREDQVVEAARGRRGGEPGDREAGARRFGSARASPRRTFATAAAANRSSEVVARVERLDVPGVAHLQPFGHVLDDDDSGSSHAGSSSTRRRRARPSSCGTTGRAGSRRNSCASAAPTAIRTRTRPSLLAGRSAARGDAAGWRRGRWSRPRRRGRAHAPPVRAGAQASSASGRDAARPGRRSSTRSPLWASSAAAFDQEAELHDALDQLAELDHEALDQLRRPRTRSTRTPSSTTRSTRTPTTTRPCSRLGSVGGGRRSSRCASNTGSGRPRGR